jgi:hypothetical protein
MACISFKDPEISLLMQLEEPRENRGKIRLSAAIRASIAAANRAGQYRISGEFGKWGVGAAAKLAAAEHGEAFFQSRAVARPVFNALTGTSVRHSGSAESRAFP